MRYINCFERNAPLSAALKYSSRLELFREKIYESLNLILMFYTRLRSTQNSMPKPRQSIHPPRSIIFLGIPPSSLGKYLKKSSNQPFFTWMRISPGKVRAGGPKTCPLSKKWKSSEKETNWIALSWTTCGFLAPIETRRTGRPSPGIRFCGPLVPRISIFLNKGTS